MHKSFASLRMTFALVIVVSAVLSFAQAKPEADEAAIRALLSKQVEAWNRGDLEGFMAGYWNSPELSFISGATETQGWQPTLERYRKKYQGEGKEMGKLDFSDLSIEMLGRDAAFVRGRFHLSMSNGQEPSGLFTLILRKFSGGWKIIHDHTS